MPRRAGGAKIRSKPGQRRLFDKFDFPKTFPAADDDDDDVSLLILLFQASGCVGWWLVAFFVGSVDGVDGMNEVFVPSDEWKILSSAENTS